MKSCQSVSQSAVKVNLQKFWTRTPTRTRTRTIQPATRNPRPLVKLVTKLLRASEVSCTAQ